jgi:hypothetical protein
VGTNGIFSPEGEAMAKTKKQTPEVNKSEWFRNYFRQHEDEARESNLENVKKSWAETYPKIPWDKKVTQSMHAARSTVRDELGIKGRKRRKKSRKGARAAAGAAANAAVKAAPGRKRGGAPGVLKDLESRLDDCIMTVLKNDNEKLKPVVDSLREARLTVLKTMIGA